MCQTPGKVSPCRWAGLWTRALARASKEHFGLTTWICTNWPRAGNICVTTFGRECLRISAYTSAASSARDWASMTPACALSSVMRRSSSTPSSAESSGLAARCSTSTPHSASTQSSNDCISSVTANVKYSHPAACPSPSFVQPSLASASPAGMRVRLSPPACALAVAAARMT